jgi:membrane protein involved in colicin uptake
MGHTRAELTKLKVGELRALLEEKDADTAGLKAALIDRLLDLEGGEGGEGGDSAADSSTTAATTTETEAAGEGEGAAAAGEDAGSEAAETATDGATDEEEAKRLARQAKFGMGAADVEGVSGRRKKAAGDSDSAPKTAEKKAAEGEGTTNTAAVISSAFAALGDDLTSAERIAARKAKFGDVSVDDHVSSFRRRSGGGGGSGSGNNNKPRGGGGGGGRGRGVGKNRRGGRGGRR